MLLQLLKSQNTTKLSEIVQYLSMAPIDIDLVLYRAIKAGEVEVDKEKDRIKPLTDDVPPYYNSDLAEKISELISQYDEQDANITRNRLEAVVLDLHGSHGYPIHQFLTTMYAMEQDQIPDMPKLNTYEISVPKMGKRPYNKFKFYTYLDHQEFGSKAVNDYIAQFDKKKV